MHVKSRALSNAPDGSNDQSKYRCEDPTRCIGNWRCKWLRKQKDYIGLF